VGNLRTLHIHQLAMQSVQDEGVSVVFATLSGKCWRRKVVRDATSTDLYFLASAGLGLMELGSVCLSLGPTVLLPDGWQPLLQLPDQEIIINVTKTSAFNDEVQTWIGLIKKKKWAAAHAILESHARPRDLICLRDKHGDTALSWAVYNASRSPGALELIRSILRVVPSEAKVLSPGTGFLPLHEAAWGNASPAVAILLSAAYPGAVFTRSRSGETPHQVGQSMHGSQFWPAPQELLESAATYLGQNDEGGLDMPAGAKASVADVSAAARLAHAGVEARMEPVPAMPTQAHGLVRTCQVLRPACSDRITARRGVLQPSFGVEDDATDGVQHLREARAKECGRWAGARRTRHSRCGFIEVSEVSVGPNGAIHRLRLHVAHAVCEAASKGHAIAKWPSKATLRRERTLDRSLKFRTGAAFMRD